MNIQHWIGDGEGGGGTGGRNRISSPFPRAPYFVLVRVPINLFSIIGRFKTKTRCINLAQEMCSEQFSILISTIKWSKENAVPHTNDLN